MRLCAIPLLLVILLGADYNPRRGIRTAAAGGGGGLAVGEVLCEQSGSQVGGFETSSMSITSGSTVVLGIVYTTFGGGWEGITGSVNTTGYTQIGTDQTGLWTSTMYYLQNATGGSQTFTIDVANDYVTICIVEIDGAAATSLDTGSATYDSAEPYTGSALTTTTADTVLVAFFGRDCTLGDCNASEATFTLAAEAANGSVLAGDIWTKIVSSTGTYNVSSNDDGSDNGSGVFLAAIK